MQLDLLESKHSNKSQCARILEMFKEHGELTNYQLNKVCFRFSARIYELRKEGHEILTVREKGSLRRFIYKGREAGV